MKIKIVSLLLVVMILIFQIPSFANDEIPEPPEPYTEHWQYWVIFNYGNEIRCIQSLEPIKVTTDETKLYIHSYHEYIFTQNGWEFYRWGTTTLEQRFDNIYRANHDIAYEDGSGFFFRAEETEPDVPDDENDGFWENLEEFFSWFNPDSWFNGIVSSVQESVGILAESIEELREGVNNFLVGMGEIINLLNPFHERFFLRVAFIPSAGYMEEFRTDIKAVFDNKFSFINEIRDFLAFIFSTPILDNPGPPEFKITLPGGKWGSGSVQIIDFSIFEDYRLFIINFMRVLLWIPFLIKLYKRLPSIVY